MTPPSVSPAPAAPPLADLSDSELERVAHGILLAAAHETLERWRLLNRAQYASAPLYLLAGWAAAIVFAPQLGAALSTQLVTLLAGPALGYAGFRHWILWRRRRQAAVLEDIHTFSDEMVRRIMRRPDGERVH